MLLEPEHDYFLHFALKYVLCSSGNRGKLTTLRKLMGSEARFHYDDYESDQEGMDESDENSDNESEETSENSDTDDMNV